MSSVGSVAAVAHGEERVVLMMLFVGGEVKNMRVLLLVRVAAPVFIVGIYEITKLRKCINKYIIFTYNRVYG